MVASPQQVVAILLVVLGVGLPARQPALAFQLLRFLRLRSSALLTWPGRGRRYPRLLIVMGIVLGLVIVVKLLVLHRTDSLRRDDDAALLRLPGAADGCGSAAASIEDGVWLDSGFLPYEAIGGLTWREDPQPTLVVLPRMNRLARRLTVPPQHYAEARRAAARQDPGPRHPLHRQGARPRRPRRTRRRLARRAIAPAPVAQACPAGQLLPAPHDLHARRSGRRLHRSRRPPRRPRTMAVPLSPSFAAPRLRGRCAPIRPRGARSWRCAVVSACSRGGARRVRCRARRTPAADQPPAVHRARPRRSRRRAARSGYRPRHLFRRRLAHPRPAGRHRHRPRRSRRRRLPVERRRRGGPAAASRGSATARSCVAVADGRRALTRHPRAVGPPTALADVLDGRRDGRRVEVRGTLQEARMAQGRLRGVLHADGRAARRLGPLGIGVGRARPGRPGDPRARRAAARHHRGAPRAASRSCSSTPWPTCCWCSPPAVASTVITDAAAIRRLSYLRYVAAPSRPPARRRHLRRSGLAARLRAGRHGRRLRQHPGRRAAGRRRRRRRGSRRHATPAASRRR